MDQNQATQTLTPSDRFPIGASVKSWTCNGRGPYLGTVIEHAGPYSLLVQEGSKIVFVPTGLVELAGTIDKENE